MKRIFSIAFFCLSVYLTEAQSDTTDLSDLSWISANSDYSPVEVDMSAGDSGSGDGSTLNISGQTFSKGFGVYGNSHIEFLIRDRFAYFETYYGIDTWENTNANVVFEIRGDNNELLFQSDTMKNGDPAGFISLSVHKHDTLKLITVKADQTGGDWADWGAPKISPKLSLPDMQWDWIDADRFAPEINTSDGGRTLEINNVTYEKGISLFPPTTVRYNLNKRFKTFKFDVGFQDTPYNTGTRASANMRILVSYDGTSYTNKLYTVVRGRYELDNFEIDVENAVYLIIELTRNMLDGPDYVNFVNSELIITDCNGDTGGTAYIGICGECIGGNTGKTECEGEQNLDLSGINFQSHVPFGILGINKAFKMSESDADYDIKLDNVTYSKGISGVADQSGNTELSYDLNGNFASFSTIVGLEQNLAVQTYQYATFIVEADGSEIYNSGLISSADDIRFVHVNIQGVDNLVLKMVNPSTSPAFLSLGDPHFSTFDCNGVIDGSAYMDDCGVCVGGNTGKTETTCSGEHEVYLSDMVWINEQNGWGPVERDQAIGQQERNDGTTISMDGSTYSKGLGVHSESRMKFFLGKDYSRFTSTIGLDDQNANGSVEFLVLGDGTELYNSGLINTKPDIRDITVNVAEINILELVVTDGGDGITQDVANWANALFKNTDCNGDVLGGAYIDECGTCVGGNTGLVACEQDCKGVWGGDAFLDNCGKCYSSGYSGPINLCEKDTTIYLSDWEWEEATNGFGPVELDQSNGGNGQNDGNTMEINGVFYSKGLGVHANSSITYALNQNFSLFEATIGKNRPQNASVIFQVLLDDSLAYESPLVNYNAFSEDLSISVSGVDTLKLIVNDGGDGTGGDHANWAEARLTTGDCNGDIGGSAFIDECGTCVGGTTGETACLQDCNGEWGGSAEYNICGFCVGGSTGLPLDYCDGDTTLYISDLSSEIIIEGTFNKNTTLDGETIKLENRPFTKGLSTQAPAEIKYPLLGKFSRFEAEIGIDDNVFLNASVVFEVLVDDSLIFESPVITHVDHPVPLDLSISNADTLALRVRDAGNGSSNDKAIWADARISNVDCHGDLQGTAFVNNCGTCVGGNTGLSLDTCTVTNTHRRYDLC